MATELMTSLPYVLAGLASTAAAGTAWIVLGRAAGRKGSSATPGNPVPADSAKLAASRVTSTRNAEASAQKSNDYVLFADHQAVVNALKSEIADLRSSVISMEVRMKALKQRQDHQLEAMAGGRDIDERSASFTTEDLVALARQGWSSRDIARVARLSAAEADLLTRLHGQSLPAVDRGAAHGARRMS